MEEEEVCSILLKSDRNLPIQRNFSQVVKDLIGNRWIKKGEKKENKQGGAMNGKRSKVWEVEHVKDKFELYHQEVQESRTDTDDLGGTFSGV